MPLLMRQGTECRVCRGKPKVFCATCGKVAR